MNPRSLLSFFLLALLLTPPAIAGTKAPPPEVQIDGTAYFSLKKLATSLGGVESLVSQPSATSHHGLTREERLKRGIGDGMLRLSVGLEDAEDLIADLNQALG